MLYRPEIDGLRAIAVLSVVSHHAGVPGFIGGYHGVDIFFVISGFLICSILLTDIARGEFSLATFYERRARRILPALLLVVSATIPVAWYVLQPVKFGQFSESIVATLLFGANIYFWRTIGYFSDDAGNSPLLHMWSLAVEEQFYIFFPLVLYAITRRYKPHVAVIFSGFALASLLFAEIGWRWKPEANFYLPIGRAWELLAGATVAAGVPGHQIVRSFGRELLALGGLGLILLSIFGLDNTTPVPSLHTLIPVSGTVLVLGFATVGSSAAWVLSLRPMVSIGLISYSLYLWHQPVLALGRMSSTSDLGGIETSLLLLGAVALAWLSWRFVERPFRKVGRISRQQVMWFSGLSCGSLLGVAMAVILSPDAVRQIYMTSLTAEAAARYRVIESAATDSGFGDGSGCVFWSDLADPALPERTRICAKDGRGILILGDSHAHDLFEALADANFAPFLVSLHQPGCQPHRRLNMRVTEPCNLEQLFRTVVSVNQNFRLILFTEAGGAFYGPGDGPFDPQRLTPVLVDEMASYLERVQAATGLSVLVLGPQPSPGFHPTQLNPRYPLAPQLTDALSDSAMAVVEEVDRALAQRLSGSRIRFISKRQLAGIELPRDLLIDGKLTYRDGSHWNAHGETVFGRRLRAALMDE